MSKRRLAARHMHTAKAAMFALRYCVVQSNARFKCRHAQKYERTHRMEKIKYIKDTHRQFLLLPSQKARQVIMMHCRPPFV